MAVFKCKMCGGTIEFEQGATVGICDSCGTKQTLPRLDDDKKANLYDRANHFRRNNEYDKAMSIYEKILEEDNTDAEAYWSIILCRYGVEYVEDPSTHKRVPTVNRAQFGSVVSDKDYKSALSYCDVAQKAIYEAEAKAIDDIQKGILEISQKEEPFDVVICYKETDNNGRRTPDSVLATELYHELTKEGFKVFFSRITLEDKLGTAYEPYIFAALNSSKVMVALGTKPEYFNAVWVKNEWSRYLSLIKSGEKKVLIPAYRDMDPYDLPEEFSHLQAQDMSKLGFMQDLTRGIKKIVSVEAPKETVKETVVVNNTVADTNTAPLLRRAFMFLEDGNFAEADAYCEKVLDLEPECARAYLGKLMAELKVKKEEELKNCAQPFDDKNNCVKSSKFSAEIAEKLKADNDFIRERNETARKQGIYSNAVSAMNTANSEVGFKAISNEFKSISGFKDSDEKAKLCLKKAEDARIEEEKAEAERKRKAEEKRIAAEKKKAKRKKMAMIITPIIAVVIVFIIILNSVIIPKQKLNRAMNMLESGDYDSAYALLEEIGNTEKINESMYNRAVEFVNSGDKISAYLLFAKLSGYKDSVELLREIMADTVSAESSHTVGLKSDGTVVATEYTGDEEYYFGESDVDSWTDIVAISAGFGHTVGLKSDGTVVAVGYNDDRCDVSSWTDIVAVSAGDWHTVGLKSDGTVVAIGSNYDGQCDVSDWKDIIAVSAGDNHTVALKADGTVVATEYTGDEKYYDGQCDVDDWTDIVAVSAGDNHTVGLKSDGTVVATEYTGDEKYYFGRCDVDGWTDIIAVSAGNGHTVGLKADGTVVAVGWNDDGQCDVSDWTDIVAVSAGDFHTVGLKKDGTVVATGYNDDGQCDVSDWKDIKLPKTK